MGQVPSSIVRYILFSFHSVVPKSILPREEEGVEKRVVTKLTLMKQHSNLHSKVPNSILPREEEDVEKRVVIEEILIKQCSNLHSKVPNSILPREEDAKKRVVIREDVKKRVVIKEDVKKRVVIKEIWMKHYTNLHKILLVGEGDFSFSASLAVSFGSATNMIATSLDSTESLMNKHPSARYNLKQLEELGCTILHKVNAITMSHHPQLPMKLFDRIVFNFPNAGFYLSEHNSIQILLHKNVVMGFLNSACKMLRANGEVHVTHKTAHPFNKWEIEKLAEDVGLLLVEKSRFSKWDYPGYDDKRGDVDRSNQTFPVGECCTFKFAKTPIFSFY